LETNEQNSLFVDPHSASIWTSARQTLHPVKFVVTSRVGLTLSSLIDSSASGLVCFTCMCKRGLCLQVSQILLLELRRSCRLDLDCLTIAILSLAHRAQFLVAKVLTALIGLPCQMTLQVIPPFWLTGGGFASWNCVAKHLEHGSDFLPSLTSFWTSLKCCCILALSFTITELWTGNDVHFFLSVCFQMSIADVY